MVELIDQNENLTSTGNHLYERSLSFNNYNKEVIEQISKISILLFSERYRKILFTKNQNLTTLINQLKSIQIDYTHFYEGLTRYSKDIENSIIFIQKNTKY